MEVIIKSNDCGIDTTMQVRELEFKEVTHTTDNAYVECMTVDGVRLTLCLSQKEAERIGTEAVIMDNEDWERYKCEMGKRYEEESQ